MWGQSGPFDCEDMKKNNSLLFVPAKQKMLEKIPSFSADAFIIDLEDSIPVIEKRAALEAAIDFLRTHDSANCYVRIDRALMSEQLSQLRCVGFQGYMIPKIESVDVLISNAEHFKGREVVALIETPRGLANVKEIAECPFVTSLAFGAEDYTAFCGMTNRIDNLLYHKSRIVMYAKANGKHVYDTPCFNLDDVSAAEDETKLAVEMGFDGKLAIHPKMIPMIARAFGDYDFAYLKSVIEQYEAQGSAVLKLGETVFEKMHIDHFCRILKENGYK